LAQLCCKVRERTNGFLIRSTSTAFLQSLYLR
jgi:hypothetical protein